MMLQGLNRGLLFWSCSFLAFVAVCDYNYPTPGEFSGVLRLPQLAVRLLVVIQGPCNITRAPSSTCTLIFWSVKATRVVRGLK